MDKKRLTSLFSGLGLVLIAAVGFFLLKPDDKTATATSSALLSSQTDAVTSASIASTPSPSGETDSPTPSPSPAVVDYTFRNENLLNQHYDKHGREMGFSSAEEYEEAACRVINDPSALHKTEAEDGDDIFYLEETNEFVVLATDGYIRTYFLPDAGRAYYDRQ